jgi:hypothetical protein
MYKKTAMGIVPDGVNYIAGRDGKAVDKPSSNSKNLLNSYVESVLLNLSQPIAQIELARLLYDDTTFNFWEVYPHESVNGIGARRFNVEKPSVGVQAIQNHVQRMWKSGKYPWLKNLEEDGSETDMQGNAYAWCHVLNLPLFDDTELDIQEVWLEPAID